MELKPGDEYRQFKADIEDVHRQLFQVKNSFNDAVSALGKMQDLASYVSEICGHRLVPISDKCDERIPGITSDEDFALTLSRILHDKSVLARCDGLRLLAEKTISEIVSFKSKVDKLAKSIVLMPRGNSDDEIAYKAAVMAKTRAKSAYDNRTARLNTIIDKYLRQRRSIFMKMLGMDELLFKMVKKSGRAIAASAFNAAACSVKQVFDSILANDASATKKGILDE